jgi:alpha-glucosidase
MYLFNKHFHPANFAFAHRADGGKVTSGGDLYDLKTRNLGHNTYHIEIGNPEVWPGDDRAEPLAGIAAPAVDRQDAQLEITSLAGLRLFSPDGRIWLQAADRHWFGTSGTAWMFRFERSPDMRFFGLGEKHTPFERSGRAYRFWNVDAWADHPFETIVHGDYDPDYISIPYLIVQQDGIFIGLLMDCPHGGMISIADDADLSGFLQSGSAYPPSILIGAEHGRPSLYCIFGPSLPDLTRKFQRLTGTTALPPIWALGYHQSRWGYEGAADLNRLADRFKVLDFPVDGLWLDIDYMHRYKVFTIDRQHLPQPATVTAELEKRGLRVVPILDPGIKREAGDEVYESGRRQGVFCLNPSGGEFVGMVWPGLSVFPDFSLPEARRWWAEYARRFFELGFAGAWLDMNDPSTGPIDCHAMRFHHGRVDHGAYHNQYALLMARATREGFAAAFPDRRPFLVSRSGCTGSQRYAAHWTGDNYSNYHHLHRSIGKSLNLALSGIPFNGPDVGGFGGDCTENLLIDWIKAAFLFPLLRNHTVRGSRPQEPWAYSPQALRVIRRFVRLRYTWMPYLYNLFIEQELSGEAILRPLFYDFDGTPELPLEHIDDQFMVGPFIMQAPFVSEKGRSRSLTLPHGRWLRADTGQWLAGGRQLSIRRERAATALFFREGGLIHFQPGIRRNNHCNLNDIGLLCCLQPSFTGTAHYRYRSDDGLTLAYQQGKRSEISIEAGVSRKHLHLRVRICQDGFGTVRVTPYSFFPFPRLILEQEGTGRELRAEPERVRFTGGPIIRYRWQ